MENIEQYLPQRPPFLFVDDVKVEGTTIFASRTFHSDEWFFAGHFPGYPIVPGVLLVESMAQAGGVGAKIMGIRPQSLFVFAKIRTAVFKRQVRPLDTLEMEIVNLRSSNLVLLQKGIGRVGGEVAVEAEWMAMASGVPE